MKHEKLRFTAQDELPPNDVDVDVDEDETSYVASLMARESPIPARRRSSDEIERFEGEHDLPDAPPPGWPA